MSFKVFDSKDKLENMVSTVAEPMWSSAVGTLTTFFTGSVQSSNTGKYYYDVHSSDDQTTDVQFAVSYGHRLGSGSEGGTATGETNPTKAIYSQFRQVLLPAETTKFNFHGDSGTNYYSDDVLTVVANRARYREKMDPGNWELHLTSGSNTIKLIDDSGASSNSNVGDAQREFWVVSGSIANGVHTTATSTATSTTSGSYGLFYPETGIILLNPSSLSSGLSDRVMHTMGSSASTNDLNHRKLFTSIKSGSYFASRREERKRSSFYFCRVQNTEFNHSQNPSYFTGSNATLVNNSFITEPTSYITTVGLYNDKNELLAVAKLSQPFKKDQNTEALIKVRLDF
ncbi:hypothetical protein HOE22_00155 [Candidatus Woesearchaeota archaeon]|jgi:hypothetical protein|nr:hypothetical protein [Candidatus Woesearchaeota archaeon]MBT4730510.1 hypothetical protein [Candidatus Woesearchaeota archaeon]MBT7555763.1 hypothetical protein [Candidatus Woesearchaeota archaeon]